VGTSARLLRLLSLLQTPRDWTGAELAERLEVSPRTIRHDIDRLRGLGYPVHANRGAIGGYRLEPGANLPPLLLEDDEAVAVAVGLRTAAGGAVTGIEETSLRALAKVEQVLPTRLRRKVNALQTSTILVTQRPGPTVDADVLSLLAGACRDHAGLRFDYEDRRGSPSRRTVEPHRLVNAGRRWYLVAWDTDRTDWRTFRVDRLRPYLPLGGRFVPRPLSDEAVQALVARGVPPTARRYQARILVHAPAATIAERSARGSGRSRTPARTAAISTPAPTAWKCWPSISGCSTRTLPSPDRPNSSATCARSPSATAGPRLHQPPEDASR